MPPGTVSRYAPRFAVLATGHSSVTEGSVTDIHRTAESDRLSVTRTVTGDVVVTASGELDHDTGGHLHEALLPGGLAVPERVVVDMSDITFMDSSGINILIAAYQKCEASQGWLRLASPTAPVLRVIELVGLDQMIPCYPSVDHAVTA